MTTASARWEGFGDYIIKGSLDGLRPGCFLALQAAVNCMPGVEVSIISETGGLVVLGDQLAMRPNSIKEVDGVVRRFIANA